MGEVKMPGKVGKEALSELRFCGTRATATDTKVQSWGNTWKTSSERPRDYEDTWWKNPETPQESAECNCRGDDFCC
jgi:hypothetical protein